MKVLIIILSVILILCAVGAAGVLLRRNSDMTMIMDWHRKKKEIPPIRTGLPEIPYDAVLYSLNWGQSSLNEYECFAFDLTRDDGTLSLSGSCVDPKSGKYTTRENLRLTEEQWSVIAQCLREGRHSPPPVRHGNEAIYDETDSCLSVCWKTSDGGSISVKYDGRKEKALCELLKSLLPDSEEEES